MISELFGIIRAELDNSSRQIEPNATNVDHGGDLVILPTLNKDLARMNPELGPNHDFNGNHDFNEITAPPMHLPRAW